MHAKRVDLERLSPEWSELSQAACDARRNAYAPYSGFPVGAAVRADSGKIYGGCNVENVSSGLTVCAERVAVWNAVASGENKLIALVVVTDSGSTPCGACRQVMQEFATDLPILVADTKGQGWLTSMRRLFPDPFPHGDYGVQLE